MPKASDYIAKFLKANHATCVFELVGGMITHMLDSLHQQGGFEIVSMHHEQAAAFAADAFGRMTGRPGIAMATSGPGATNLLTGVGSCYFDSSPAIFITGQVNRHEMKGARLVRQLGFQETDIVTVARPITKGAFIAEHPEDLPELLERAFRVSTTGRPGPVLVDIPMDVQRGELAESGCVEVSMIPRRASSEIEPAIAKIASAFKNAKRPLILAGGGVRSARAADDFRRFVDRAGVPVVYSLMGVDLLPYTHPLRVGMIGSYGNRWANLALANADCLLVLGSRLDIRQTGADTKSFKGERAIFHVDCDAAEMNNRVTGCETVVAELSGFLKHVAGKFPAEPLNCAGWISEIRELREKWPDTAEIKTSGINPNSLMHQLSKLCPNAAAYVADVGQHQMWAAQSLELNADQRFLTSGGMGSMGFGLPAAIGACYATKKMPVVLIAGDGGFQCNIQELQTVVRNRLPVKMVIINNGCHGMVRQFQESYFDKRYQSTLWGYSAPDFAKIAAAYGISAQTVSAESELDSAFKTLWSDPSSPALLQVMIDASTNVYPKLAFGRPISEMEPFAKPLGMEGT